MGASFFMYFYTQFKVQKVTTFNIYYIINKSLTNIIISKDFVKNLIMMESSFTRLVFC